jgi:hypothetical protein
MVGVVMKLICGVRFSLGPDGLKGFAQAQVAFRVGRAVGDVEDDDVHSGVDEHVAMLADHVGVVRDVVAVFRFAPVVESAGGGPLRVGGVFFQDLGNVVGSVRHRGLQPEEVEHRHDLALARVAALGIAGQLAAQVVHGDPGVAHAVAGWGGCVRRPRDPTGTGHCQDRQQDTEKEKGTEGMGRHKNVSRKSREYRAAADRFGRPKGRKTRSQETGLE